MASSDALRSIPFTLIGKDVSGVAVDFIPNNGHAKVYKSKDQTKKVTVIKIPKNTVGFVNVGKYKVKETINHFPLVRIVCVCVCVCEKGTSSEGGGVCVLRKRNKGTTQP